MERLSIGEVARQAGIAASALRYYETEGLVPPPERLSGRRVYEPAVLDRLAVIALLQRAGFTVAEMRTFLTDFPADTPPSERWQALARQKLPEVEALIARATAMKEILERGLDCTCPTMEECALISCRVPTVSLPLHQEQVL
jgi:MerR family redox-sensitive transcriptional activator SoxR